MSINETPPPSQHAAVPIHWMDIKFAVALGIVVTALKLIAHAKPEWRLNGADALVAFLLTVGYMIARGRRQPELLDEWGITTPLTWPAVAAAFVLLLIGIAGEAATGMAVAGTLPFEPSYIPNMLAYTTGAFPQEFAMCSIGLVTLAKLPLFRGAWRLPLTVGTVFCLAHFWTPAHIPGTPIPIQMVVTFPAGFFFTLYFLHFRTILPLTVIHCIVYVLGYNWVEVHL